MAVLVFAESLTGSIKKAALEAVTYGNLAAQALGTECIALTIGTAEGADKLGQYGASKVYNVAASDDFDSQVYAAIISKAAEQLGADCVVFAHSSSGKSLAGRVAVRMEAGMASAVISVPTAGNFSVQKGVFSGKGFATYEIKSTNKVLTIAPNTFRPEASGSDVAVETLAIEAPAARVKVKEQSTVEGIVPLPEAELVVSAGRGMKGPENWGMIEEMADILGATTACSRPVADVHWRPHHEHVGQTGVAIRPTLYIAVGISGAIQHLAGVNQSKVIVVINKDPEAPFFKAADYGVVGDLFEVVPRLNEALKKFKSQN
ncbi:electron transfer flavoprotein subunit alpha/FixB family protein [Aureispira sp. CCB-E]|uniref:electron transfer flavoprotein subunit alpha/FixB family protein n=1 Tax=Aureispira sp. CCB-E TaxID=3051121 RepID=UPI0028695DEA|nr:electron transfer flavoprotein subunit alpha/FixB family protein [Aureispira sp. CCB-E]WMX17516.1 electron transfer flavoprotein subunit alpha/FixB family protein [Aureispira sp. CCB-E]